MQLDEAVVDGAAPADPIVAARMAVGDARRASVVDQSASNSDQVAADADQRISDADQSASDADGVSAGIDQLASDRDQAAADRQQAAGVRLTAADQRAYEASRAERATASVEREANRRNRARTAGDRGVTAWRRDGTGHARNRAGQARDARAEAGHDAVDAWELSRRADNEMTKELGAKYRGLLEAAPDAMVVVDEVGTIVLLNLQAEHQFGYRRDELVGQNVTAIVPDGFAQRLIADDLRSPAEALAQQIGTGIELLGRRKDGTDFPIEMMLSPFQSAEGIQVTAAIRNISGRKAAEAHLLEAQKLESIGRLAAGIAHDFNNMLFAIAGYAELLEDDLATTDPGRLDLGEARLNVDGISLAARRATTLTAQLLAFGRRQVITPTVLDPNAVLIGLEPMVRQLIGTNMALELRLHQDAWHIRADAGQLEQILVNLVVNARDAMPDGGTVTIATENVLVDEPRVIEQFDVRPGPYLLVAITDTGVGMDSETRDHIFEPFFTTKELGKGTGLGLASAYGIVRQAGGHIRLASEPGAGSSFKLYFPRVDDPVSAQPPRATTVPGVTAATVLLVDDDPAIRDMTARMLRRAGNQVITVPTGAAALLRLADAESPVDVVVTDVIMPDMSGTRLAEVLLERHPTVGVVFLSGYSAGTLNLDGLIRRGVVFVAKPASSTRLMEAIQEARVPCDTGADSSGLRRS